MTLDTNELPEGLALVLFSKQEAQVHYATVCLNDEDLLVGPTGGLILRELVRSLHTLPQSNA